MNKTIQALKSRCLDAWRWSGPGKWCYGLHYRLSCWRFVFFQNIYSPSFFEASLLCEACVTKSSEACLASTFSFEKVKMIKSLDFPFLWPQGFDFESCIRMTVLPYAYRCPHIFLAQFSLYMHKSFMITLRMLVFFNLFSLEAVSFYRDPQFHFGKKKNFFKSTKNQQIKLQILTLKHIFYWQ